MWMVLEAFLRRLARDIGAFSNWCGPPVTLRLFSNGTAAS
jgi:hypothetical protein